MRAPRFWQEEGSALARILSPAGRITGLLTARRLRRAGWRAPVPVICCGNVSVGGTGKTTLALDLLARLRARGLDAHALIRGYKGAGRGVLRVDPRLHDARLVGDEALLLAGVAPTWTGADRAASARAAVAAGAACLVMDDGMQNPGLAQDAALLVVDGEAGFGNGLLLPAGPLRESVASGAARARAAILIGADRRDAAALLPPALPVLHAMLAADEAASRLAGERLVAFAGIGRPEKFFASLDRLGATPRQRVGFPDHHPYTPRDLRRLARLAAGQGARLVTTPKDAVRLPRGVPADILVAGVRLHWQDERQIEAILDEVTSPP